MFFLLKCLACIALVLFALGWRGVEGPAGQPEKQSSAATPKPPRRNQVEDGARGLAQAGADALLAAARDRCLAAPGDCAALLQRFHGAGRER